MDISPESVEIAQLSLWIRTARPGQLLTDLSAHIRCGNSVVDDPAVDPKAFIWKAQFPNVFEAGGFDAVVGNPPYVRQELLGPTKTYFQQYYKVYHGMADLFVYFYEKGVQTLKPGGRLAFVVTNKWMKTGYGEPLRQFFGEETWVEAVVDFGHAKQFFKDADVFPCFAVIRKPNDDAGPDFSRACIIPRDMVRIDQLKEQVTTRGINIRRDRLSRAAWQLEPDRVNELLEKIRGTGETLLDYSGVKPAYGVKSGLNDAFLIDSLTRRRLVEEDASSQEIIKPYLRGQDVKRWFPEWNDLWMIFTRRGVDIDRYPAVKNHLSSQRHLLEPKPSTWDGGHWPGRKAGNYKWYEIQDPVEYWEVFEGKKLVIQRIAFHSRIGFDDRKMYVNDAAIVIPTSDFWLLACLNSSLLWWFEFRSFPHKKDEALAMDIPFVETLPIPEAETRMKENAERIVARLVEFSEELLATRVGILDWLKVQHEISEPSTKLQDTIALDSDAFVIEVQRARGRRNPFTAAALRGLRDEYKRTIEPARSISAEALRMEHSLHDLVNEAYGLTSEEVSLMWDTAPPRMPIPRPGSL